MTELRCRVLLVDDHPAIREGLQRVLAQEPGIEVCGGAESVDGALAESEKTRPDLVIVDLSLDESDGLDLVRTMKRTQAGVKMIVFSSRPAWLMADRCLQAGADGYLRKSGSDEEIMAAIDSVLAGRTYTSSGSVSEEDLTHPFRAGVLQMSDAEYQVFECLGKALEVAEIAEAMACSEHTVRTRLERIKGKLGVKKASELRQAAVEWRIDTLL